MATLQATDIQDLVNLTIENKGKLKITDLMHDYQNTIALKRTMKKNKMSFDGGQKVQWTLLTDDNGSARFVGIGETDVVNVPNVTTRGEVDWRHVTWNWAMDRRLIAMNSGSANRIFDIIQSQRLAAMGSAIKLFEQRFWRAPASTDTVNPYGLPYWVCKSNSEGFNGTVPSGFTVVGNVNPTTYTRWRNYTNQYTNVTKDDLITKLRKAMYKTDFEVLVEETPTYNTGDDYAIYTNYAVLATMESLAEAQNDNLGKDLASMDGKVLFRSVPIKAVTELDNDTTNPVYGVNWGEFKCMGLKGEWMNETPIPIEAGQHTVSSTHVDCTFNWFVRNRRRNFVLATDTTVMA